MARKKKKNPQASSPPKTAEQPQPFNNPFAALKSELRVTAQKPAPKAQKETPVSTEPDDTVLFEKAMQGVSPLNPQSRARMVGRPPSETPRLETQVDEDLETLAQLADLISGKDEFDLRLTGDFVSAAAPGVGPQLMERLSRCEFPIQDYLDLHGMGSEEALSEVENFLARSATRNLRHVLIVHGKGLGSPGGVPVLKNALAKVLTHKRFRKRVLAFCTARPMDGGAGAMYVLLRKWSTPY